MPAVESTGQGAEIIPLDCIRTPDYYRRMARNWERIDEVQLRVLLLLAADDMEAIADGLR